MKKLLTVTAISLAVMLVVVPLASAQQEKGGPPAGGPPGAGGPPPGGPPQGGPPADRPPAGGAAEKVFQGQLAKVDPQAKELTVKGPGNMDMIFDYTDATQVVGEKNVQGLAGKTGADLRVTYRDAAGKHTATKIEAIEKGEKGEKGK